MKVDILVLAVAAGAACALLTGVVRHFAVRRGLLDVPNARSSHLAATPRGGGLAIVLIATMAFVALAVSGEMRPQLLWVLVGGGGLVAAVGLADDRRPVRAGMRLAVHLLAAVWAVYWLGGLDELTVGHHALQLGWAGNGLAILVIMWALNLFNFMDGIDGIAASEAVFVTSAVLPSLGWLGVAGGVSAASLLVAGTTLGFLVWNWPPARIFLGDVGSGYLGYLIATLTLASVRDRPESAWIWLILGGLFFVDATVTVVRRFVSGERVHEAHRTHAYQRLARRFGHRSVTVALLVIDVCWLLPCALWAALRPSQGAAATVVALTPLVALVVAGGAGRR